jgi:hypothetical protein
MKTAFTASLIVVGLVGLMSGRGVLTLSISYLQRLAALFLWIRTEAWTAVMRVRKRYWECLREVQAR